MNGMMTLYAFGHEFWVYGGRTVERPADVESVCMLEVKPIKGSQIRVHIPTEDFQTPDPTVVAQYLPDVMRTLTHDRELYVCCMGGWGRTGLMLAIIAKAWGIKDPVGFVRSNYAQRAIETFSQEEYVAAYKVPWALKVKLRWWKLRAFIAA